jgi:lipopolysaccharide assembly protein A
MRVVSWLLRAFIFFTLFAFALNNQQPATVNAFFGAQWQAPMVIVVLAAFAVGCAVGVIAMLPDAWRRWRQHQARAAVVAAPGRTPAAPHTPAPATLPPSGFGPEGPPRVGL